MRVSMRRTCRAYLRQIEVYQGTHITRIALKLMALTFVRTGELIGARWSEIDFEEKRWNIPASSSRPGANRGSWPILPASSERVGCLRETGETNRSTRYISMAVLMVRPKTCHFFSAPVKFWTSVTGWMAASPTGIDVRIRWPSAEIS